MLWMDGYENERSYIRRRNEREVIIDRREI